MNYFKNYLNKTKSYAPLRFIFEFTAIALIGNFIIAFWIGIIVFYSNITTLPEPPDYEAISNSYLLFIFLCFFTPMIETFIAQWIPIVFFQKFISNSGIVIWLDALLFAMAHYWDYGILPMLTIIPVGVVLAWSFIVHKKRSYFIAFLVTTAIHTFYNFIIFLPRLLA